MLIKVAWDLVGGLSAPSKMPCFSYNLAASSCKTGQRLAVIEGSTCSGCYAAETREHLLLRRDAVFGGGRMRWNNYSRPNVREAMQRRLESLTNPKWVEAMATLINHYEADSEGILGYFRWHDSGDVQSREHAQNICSVARRTPKVKHWLPTRENEFVRPLLSSRKGVPKNLVIRVSAAMVGKRGPSWSKLTSTVNAGIGRKCHASQQGNQCLDCRDCWDKRVCNIDYPFH